MVVQCCQRELRPAEKKQRGATSSATERKRRGSSRRVANCQAEIVLLTVKYKLGNCIPVANVDGFIHADPTITGDVLGEDSYLDGEVQLVRVNTKYTTLTHSGHPPSSLGFNRITRIRIAVC